MSAAFSFVPWWASFFFSLFHCMNFSPHIQFWMSVGNQNSKLMLHGIFLNGPKNQETRQSFTCFFLFISPIAPYVNFCRASLYQGKFSANNIIQCYLLTRDEAIPLSWLITDHQFYMSWGKSMMALFASNISWALGGAHCSQNSSIEIMTLERHIYKREYCWIIIWFLIRKKRKKVKKKKRQENEKFLIVNDFFFSWDLMVHSSKYEHDYHQNL